MSISKIVPRQFSDDFEAVAAHYGLRELGEYDTAKAVARNDLDSAIATYATLAGEIRMDDAGHAHSTCRA